MAGWVQALMDKWGTKWSTQAGRLEVWAKVSIGSCSEEGYMSPVTWGAGFWSCAPAHWRKPQGVQTSLSTSTSSCGAAAARHSDG